MMATPEGLKGNGSCLGLDWQKYVHMNPFLWAGYA